MTSSTLTSTPSVSRTSPESESALSSPATSRDPPLAEDLGGLGLLDRLLRDRAAFLGELEASGDLERWARPLLTTVALAAAVFGATLGFYRGGLQILYSGVKLPLALLFTAAITTPALTGLRRALFGEGDLARDACRVLSGLALTSLLLAALAPVVLLAILAGAAYHAIILLAVACAAVAGAAGLHLFVRAVARGFVASRGAFALIMAGLIGLFGVVGAQMTWTLRPYFVRPRDPEPPFLRAIEGSLFEAVVISSNSARGVFVRPEAPMPEEVAP